MQYRMATYSIIDIAYRLLAQFRFLSISLCSDGGNLLFSENANEHRSDDKVETYKTGGGYFAEKTTDADRKLLAAIGDQVTPLKNPYDSDALYNNDQEDGLQISS